jgi:predicted N-acetyltransferase YhbS
MEIIFESNPSIEDIEFLEQKLFQFNCSKIDEYPYEDLIFKAIDNSNSLIACIHGQIGGGWLYIASLWVDENHRGQGVGEKLLSLAEEKACRKNCSGAYLYTYSFQCPRFHEKLGYKVFGTLEGFCDNHSKLFMKKSLA